MEQKHYTNQRMLVVTVTAGLQERKNVARADILRLLETFSQINLFRAKRGIASSTKPNLGKCIKCKLSPGSFHVSFQIILQTTAF